MPTLLAKNASVLVTMDDGRHELSNAGLFVRDGMIEQVGPTQQLPQHADLVLDLSGQIVLPGFVNTHHHLDQTLTRNLPAAQNNNLFPWLKVHYRVWASRTPEASRCSTLIGLAELAASGCTTVFDHAWRLASGIAPVKKYLAAGVEVGLGVDGSASNDGSNILLEARQALLLARLRLGLLPPEGPRRFFLLSQSHPLRAHEWMTAREALEIATRGGAAVLGRDDIGSLEVGKCADFFSIDLNTVDYAGALHDPVAATVFCAPQKARYTVIDGRVVVENGQVVTVNMRPVIDAHNRFARQFAGQS